MESTFDIVPTIFVGTKKPLDNFAALSAAAGLQAAFRNPITRYLISPDAGGLTEHFVNAALSRYSMRAGAIASNGSNLFPFNAQKAFLEKEAPISYLLVRVKYSSSKPSIR